MPNDLNQMVQGLTGAPPQPPQTNSEWGDDIKRRFTVIYSLVGVGTTKAIEQAQANVASFEAAVDELDYKMLELAAENEALKEQLKIVSPTIIGDSQLVQLTESANAQSTETVLK
jgi:hypothetical protein